MVFGELFGRKGRPPEKEEQAQPDAEELARELEAWKRRARFLAKIVERYAALVQENEEKTVPELKALVNPNEPSVQELRKEVLADLAEARKKAGEPEAPYAFERDFLRAADRAFAKVQALFNLHADLPVTFWLKPEEMLELKAADLFDKAVLLCSLLRSLEGSARVRVLELEGNRIHPVVVLAFQEREYVLDASQPKVALTTYCGKLEEVLKGFAFDDGKYLKSAYEFNDRDYQEF